MRLASRTRTAVATAAAVVVTTVVPAWAAWGAPAPATRVPSALAATASPAPTPTAGPTPTPTASPTPTGCPAAGSTRPTVPAGTGGYRNATFVSFRLSDRVTARVNVGSGNLLVETTDLALPAVTGTVTLGTVYNSLLVGSGVAKGAFGPGWRTRAGVDVRLYPASDGSVTYLAPSGVSGVFTASGTTGYTSPPEFKATLVKVSGGWELTDHDSGEKSFFTGAGLPDKVQDRNGNVTDFQYASAGAATTVVSSRGTTGARTASVTLDGSCRITRYAQTGDYNRAVSYDYGGTAVTKITTPSGRNTSFGYDGSGNLTSITLADAGGTNLEKATVAYDGSRRVTALTRVSDLGTGDGSVTRFSYPSGTQTLVAGPTTDQAQPVSSVPRTAYTVNAAKRVTKAVDPAGRTRDDAYTPFHDVASVTTAAGTTTYGHSSTVNGGESLTSITRPTGASTSLAYGNTATATNPTAAYQPSSGTDAQGNTSTFTYSGAGNLASTADATAATASVTYNGDGTPATATDPGNGTNRTTYAYDTNHQLTKVTPVTGTSLAARTFTWDGFGRLKTATDGRGVVTTYNYGTEDRLTDVSYSDGTPALKYTYDGFGNVIKRVDGAATTTYGFDKLNRLVSRASSAGGGTLTYGYDKAGNLTRVTDARGSSTMTYDAANLQTSLTTAKGTVLRYAHDNDGRRTDTWFATNSGNTTWAAHTRVNYDKSGRVARTWTAKNSTDSSRTYDTSWCYSPYTGAACPTTSASTDKALVQWSTDNLSSVRTTYTYDTANRLKKVTPTSGKTYTYSYDSRGNRLTAADGTTTQTLTFNAANQVTSSGYAYDAAGNQTVDPAGGTVTYNGAGQMSARTGTAYAYTYAGTTQDELLRQNLPDSRTLSYTYGYTDQFGRPVVQSLTKSDTGTTYLDHDGRGTPQVLTTTSGNENFYVLNNLGTPVQLIRTDGVTSAEYAYDPYGAYSTGTATGDAAGINPYRFATNGVYDRGTGYLKYGERWYNPKTGRFTQQDSIERLGDPSEGNRYAYAACNPVNNVDPNGTCSTSSVLGALSGIVGGASAAAGTWALAGVVSVPFTAGAILIGGGILAAGLGVASLGYCLAGD